MKLFLLFVLVFSSTVVRATPKNIQLWFLKESALKNLQTYLDNKFPPYVSTRSVADAGYNCVPMGDGCFHPQLGFVESKSNDALKEPVEEETKEPIPEAGLNTFNSDSVENVDCSKNANFFDIYCGKSKKTATSWNAKTEIWIDVSSSFNTVDPVNGKGQCYRRQFVERVVNNCGGRDKINVRSYNTRIKEVGMFDSLCLAYGTNNTDMLIKWIENSNVENLVIITDASEISLELTDFLETVRAKTKGADSINLFAENLLDFSGEVVSLCK